MHQADPRMTEPSISESDGDNSDSGGYESVSDGAEFGDASWVDQ